MSISFKILVVALAERDGIFFSVFKSFLEATETKDEKEEEGVLKCFSSKWIFHTFIAAQILKTDHEIQKEFLIPNSTKMMSSKNRFHV